MGLPFGDSFKSKSGNAANRPYRFGRHKRKKPAQVNLAGFSVLIRSFAALHVESEGFEPSSKQGIQ